MILHAILQVGAERFRFQPRSEEAHDESASLPKVLFGIVAARTRYVFASTRYFLTAADDDIGSVQIVYDPFEAGA